MKPRIIYDLSEIEYRNWNAVSKSDLDLAAMSPALCDWNRALKTDGSEAVNRGSNVHAAILEPDRFSREYSVIPDMRPAEKDEFLKKVGDRPTVTEKQKKMIDDMTDSVRAHPVANWLLFSEGVSESSIFAELNGYRVKCRPDRIVGGVNGTKYGHIIADLKVTDDIEKFASTSGGTPNHYSAKKFRYDLQSVFYSDIYEKLTGVLPRFIFVVIGVKRSIGRHPVRVFEFKLDRPERDSIVKKYQENIRVIGEWNDFGFSLDVESIYL